MVTKEQAMKNGTTALHQSALLVRRNVRLAKQLTYNHIHSNLLHRLRTLTTDLGLSLERGDLQLLVSGWHVTHSGLLRIAHQRKCFGVRTALQKDLSDPTSNRWVFKAIVYTTPRSRGFVGYGDADPSNVSPLVRGAELRVAETRAVNRALRKAYGIGLCSVEELGAFSAPRDTGGESDPQARSNGNGSPGNGQPRLRDRLCQLIRQHHLDASLVKRYAAEFCGTQSLRDASRGLVEDFINHLSGWAARDLDGLVCHLNRYSKSPQPEEVHS
jgi:hypothetical protein